MEYNSSITVVTMIISVFIIIGYLMISKSKGSSTSIRSLEDLTHEERYMEHNVTTSKNDVERVGRWKVSYMDGSQASKLGYLSRVLGDSSYTFSPAVRYREIR